MQNLPSPKLSEATLKEESALAQSLNSFPAQRAAVLLGCYRKGDAQDPETYTAAVAAILSEYSMEVIQHVTDPRTGLARKTNWLPTVAEVDAACMNHSQWCVKRDELMRRGWRFECGNWIKPGEAA